MIRYHFTNRKLDEAFEVGALVVVMICTPIAAESQGFDDPMLPLRTARLGERIRRRVKDEWYELIPHGKEFSYCVSGWTPEKDQRGDTVFIVTEVQLVKGANAREHGINGFECVGKGGEELPIIHAHPAGDCSPSRSDIEAAVGRKAPFEMIICGPESSVSYGGELYRMAILGYGDVRRSKIAQDTTKH